MSSRLPPFHPDSATSEQQSVLREILNGPRGNLNGPFLGWIHSPELAQHAQRLGAFCRYQTGVPAATEEAIRLGEPPASGMPSSSTWPACSAITRSWP